MALMPSSPAQFQVLLLDYAGRCTFPPGFDLAIPWFFVPDPVTGAPSPASTHVGVESVQIDLYARPRQPSEPNGAVRGFAYLLQADVWLVITAIQDPQTLAPHSPWRELIGRSSDDWIRHLSDTFMMQQQQESDRSSTPSTTIKSTWRPLTIIDGNDFSIRFSTFAADKGSEPLPWETRRELESLRAASTPTDPMKSFGFIPSLHTPAELQDDANVVDAVIAFEDCFLGLGWTNEDAAPREPGAPFATMAPPEQHQQPASSPWPPAAAAVRHGDDQHEAAAYQHHYRHHQRNRQHHHQHHHDQQRHHNAYQHDYRHHQPPQPAYAGVTFPPPTMEVSRGVHGRPGSPYGQHLHGRPSGPYNSGGGYLPEGRPGFPAFRSTPEGYYGGGGSRLPLPPPLPLPLESRSRGGPGTVHPSPSFRYPSHEEPPAWQPMLSQSPLHHGNTIGASGVAGRPPVGTPQSPWQPPLHQRPPGSAAGSPLVDRDAWSRRHPEHAAGPDDTEPWPQYPYPARIARSNLGVDQPAEQQQQPQQPSGAYAPGGQELHAPIPPPHYSSGARKTPFLIGPDRHSMTMSRPNIYATVGSGGLSTSGHHQHHHQHRIYTEPGSGVERLSRAAAAASRTLPRLPRLPSPPPLPLAARTGGASSLLASVTSPSPMASRASSVYGDAHLPPPPQVPMPTTARPVRSPVVLGDKSYPAVSAAGSAAAASSTQDPVVEPLAAPTGPPPGAGAGAGAPVPSPRMSKSGRRGKPGVNRPNKAGRACAVCLTTESRLWRRGGEHHMDYLCNACGLRQGRQKRKFAMLDALISLQEPAAENAADSAATPATPASASSSSHPPLPPPRVPVSHEPAAQFYPTAPVTPADELLVASSLPTKQSYPLAPHQQQQFPASVVPPPLRSAMAPPTSVTTTSLSRIQSPSSSTSSLL